MPKMSNMKKNLQDRINRSINTLKSNNHTGRTVPNEIKNIKSSTSRNNIFNFYLNSTDSPSQTNVDAYPSSQTSTRHFKEVPYNDVNANCTTHTVQSMKFH
jgi:hypothetical protein